LDIRNTNLEIRITNLEIGISNLGMSISNLKIGIANLKIGISNLVLRAKLFIFNKNRISISKVVEAKTSIRCFYRLTPAFRIIPKILCRQSASARYPICSASSAA